MTIFLRSCSWICSEVVQAIDWAVLSITTWRARWCLWRAPHRQTQLHFTLPLKYKRRTNLGNKHQPNHERGHQELKNAKIHFRSHYVHQKALTGTSFSSWQHRSINTPLRTCICSIQSIKSRLSIRMLKALRGRGSGYLKNLFMVSHNWYPCIPQKE